MTRFTQSPAPTPLVSSRRGAATTLGTSVSGGFSDERKAYEEVQAAYDRAVTLCQTREINAIWPALRTAKKRLLAAEVGL